MPAVRKKRWACIVSHHMYLYIIITKQGFLDTITSNWYKLNSENIFRELIKITQAEHWICAKKYPQ